MRVIAGLLHHETNTLSPVKTSYDDFDVARGKESLDKIAGSSFFREAKVELIPTLYANALPSGKVEEKTFLGLRDGILTAISEAGKVDGIWLCMHGSMEVENIGSGEGNLISEIRKIVGFEIPIAIALDFHANIAESLVEEANIICGYRTAPHVDQVETQVRAGQLLLECIRNELLLQPVIVRPPLLTAGDMFVTTVDPGKSLMRELEVTDARDGIFCASIFGGQPWVDAPNTGASVVVTAKDNQRVALKEAKRLAKLLWDAREEFHFEEEAAEPEESVERALRAKELVFITDSGDNTTAGAPGDNAYLLSLLLEKGAKDTLVAGITDSEAIELCKSRRVGEEVEFQLGGKLDKEKSQSVKINGILRGKGRILGWFGEDAGPAVIVSVRGIEIIITEKRCGFVSPEIIELGGLSPLDYKIIVVKLGYLWDALRKISGRTIIALTPGASCEAIEEIEFHNVRRPVYPLDKNFSWIPDNKKVEEKEARSMGKMTGREF